MASNKIDHSNYRRTKIVATMGPASRDPEMLKKLILTGVNVFRLNFSHGSHEEHLENLKNIRKAAEETGKYISVLQDLSGPKLRISNIDGGFTSVLDRDEIVLKLDKEGKDSTSETIYVSKPDPKEVLKPGHTILLSDGIIVLEAEEILEDGVKCRIIKGGRLRAKAGIAFPDSDFELPATTDKDLKDLEWGLEHKINYVAISFVNNAQDVLNLRKRINEVDSDIKIIAKIERKVALDNIEEIADVSDGLMIARGDLGLELPLEVVPHVQRDLIHLANQRGIPVIVATQMLHSMVNSIRPTRAEASDIATAVLTGTDAVMLSEETAIGQNPIEAVQYLSNIARTAELKLLAEDIAEHPLRFPDVDTVPDGIAYAACAAGRKLDAQAIVVCTKSGKSVRLVGKYRPIQPLIGVSPHARTLCRMALFWGVIPILSPESVGRFEEVEEAMQAVQENFEFASGSRIVVTNGVRTNLIGSTNILEIREIG